MTIIAQFAAPAHLWPTYAEPLARAFADAGLDVHLAQDHAPGLVDYIIFAPGGTISDFGPYVRAKAVLNLWAGVEAIVGNRTLTQPLTRMVDDGLTQGMVEYVTAHALRHHVGMDAHIANPSRLWQPVMPPLAAERPVTVLGLGALGSACALMLARIGFPVTGWCRDPRQVEGLRCLSGPDGLVQALTGAAIVVTLLPLTPATTDLLNAGRLALLAPGAVIINPGRGALIDDAALLAALDSGQVGHATLDVFRVEPLPADHPFWTHPRVTVTPHTAAWTRPQSSADVIAENIRRGQEGAPFLHLVDRTRGY